MKRVFIVSSLIGSLLVGAVPVNAASSATDEGFDPNAILSDSDIFDYNAFPLDRMVNFLRRKGTLADYRTPDIDGIPKTAPEIIWRVSQSYKINPKYLLALIQKEQSLVEDPNPTQKQFDWAAGYGICDSCSKDDPSVQEFKGFASQLEWAAKQHREKYLMQLLTRGITIGGQGLGKPVTIDGLTITPANRATAMLYSYTPHIHGNLTLWRIWKRWFSINYPDGTIVRAKTSGTTYQLRFGEKRPFASRAVVASLVDEAKIISVEDTDLNNYPDGKTIKFSPYSILRDPKGRIFLLTMDAKRQIANMEAFRKFGFNEDEIEDVEDSDLAGYPDGPKITVATAFPQGVLMKLASAPGVWYVEDGVRQPLLDGSLLKLYFRGRQIKTVTAKTLEGYTQGEPYRLHDGELVKSSSSPTVYVVEHALLRPIPSGDVFESVGWKWKNVVTVPPSLLAAHPAGDPFVQAPPEQTELAQAPL